MIFVKKQKTKIGKSRITARVGSSTTRGKSKSSTNFRTYSHIHIRIKCGMFECYSIILEAFNAYALPLTRRIFPQLLAQSVVGVQPMTKPSGLAFALRYMYGDEFERFNELV